MLNRRSLSVPKHTRAVPVLFAFLLFIFATPNASFGAKKSTAAAPPPTVALAPLDNRPPCLDYTVRIANIAGVRPLLPPYSAIGAYTYPGEPDELIKWLETLPASTDYLVISLDMLAYGGLVASRLPDTPLETAEKRIAALNTFAESHPRTKVLAFGTIQRIARTATGIPAQDSATTLIAEYLKKTDEAEATNNALLRQNLKSMKTALPKGQLEEYFAARARNHEINRRSIGLLKSGAIDYLVIAMDDNAPYGPHRAERDKLMELLAQSGADERGIIKPGADEVAQLLMARALHDHSGAAPKFAVGYYTEAAENWTPPLEDRPLSVSVPQALEIAGIAIAKKDEKPDAYLMVYGTSFDTGSATERETIAKLTRDTGALIAKGKLAGIADLRYVNRADPALVEALSSGIDITQLAAYSGWNTAGNALGTAIAHLAARRFMDSATDESALRERAAAHCAFLLQRFLDDYIYMADARQRFISDINAAGQNPFRIGGDSYAGLRDSLKDYFLASAREFFNKRFKGRIIKAGYAKRSFAFSISDFFVSLQVPWFRAFEAEINTRVDLERVKSQ